MYTLIRNETRTEYNRYSVDLDGYTMDVIRKAFKEAFPTVEFEITDELVAHVFSGDALSDYYDSDIVTFLEEESTAIYHWDQSEYKISIKEWLEDWISEYVWESDYDTIDGETEYTEDTYEVYPK